MPKSTPLCSYIRNRFNPLRLHRSPGNNSCLPARRAGGRAFLAKIVNQVSANENQQHGMSFDNTNERKAWPRHSNMQPDCTPTAFIQPALDHCLCCEVSVRLDSIEMGLQKVLELLTDAAPSSWAMQPMDGVIELPAIHPADRIEVPFLDPSQYFSNTSESVSSNSYMPMDICEEYISAWLEDDMISICSSPTSDDSDDYSEPEAYILSSHIPVGILSQVESNQSCTVTSNKESERVAEFYTCRGNKRWDCMVE